MKKIGRYEVVSELGRGAMGIVYKAADPTIGREVALKVISLNASPEEGANSPQEMFMREVRAAGRLTHPAIVAIHDAFDDKENQTSCIVMEFVPGRTLQKILDSNPLLTTTQILNLIRQVAAGLDFAHRNQVIHRDLKPANILVTDDGRAKITDFGIAKVLAREGVVRTVGVMGTPSYMSPEQVRGGEIDARTDIFSLGIIFFTMLTGQKPFAGNTAAVLFKIVYEEPAVPSSLNPQLTPAHDYVVKKCLAKDRDLRYSSARELLGDLEDLQRGRQPRSQAAVSAPAAPPPPPAAPPEGRTIAMPIPQLMKAGSQHPSPVSPPPPVPPKPVAAPPPKPAAPQSAGWQAEAGGPVSPPAKGQTLVMPIPELMKAAPHRPSPIPPSGAAPAPPGLLLKPVPSTKPAMPPTPPVQPSGTPEAPPPLDRTLPMHVPDLAAEAAPPPLDRTLPMHVPDLAAETAAPPLDRTLPMHVPDLAAEAAPPPLDRTLPMHVPDLAAEAAPPPLDQTLPMHVPDLAAAGPPPPRSQPTAPAPSVPREPTQMHRTLPLRVPDIAAAAPVTSEPVRPAPLVPPPVPAITPQGRPEAPPAVEPLAIPGPQLPATKSRLIPAILGVMTVVLLGGAMFAYWKLHQKRVVPSPPAPIAVQPQPATPLPVPAPPAAPPTQPPATLTAQVEKPVSAPSEVAKKPVISKPKAPAARHEVATEPTTPTPQPQPEVVAPPPQPAPPTPSPEPVAKPEPVKLASIPRIVQVECVYGLKEATFTFSSGGQTLLQETLKGRKKGKFAVIKGAYEGTFSHTITVPAGASQVSVHVVAKDGSTDLSKTIEMPPPGGFVPTLAVDVDNEHLSLDWKSSSAPK